MHSFTFNGHSSDEFGIRIERFPDLNRSARKYKSATVPGRNGNIYQMQNAWEEVTVSYQIFAGERQAGAAVTDFTDIVEWLNSADDYAVLTDTYDPTHYRMAVFVDDLDIESSWHTFGKATIKFRCRPQRYLMQSPISVNDGDTITNTTKHTALPVITLTGSGAHSLLDLEKPVISIGYSLFGWAENFLSYTAWINVVYSEAEGRMVIIFRNPDNATLYTQDNTTGTYDFSTWGSSYTGYYGLGTGLVVIPDSDYCISCTANKASSVKVTFFDSEGNRYITGVAENSIESAGTLSLVFHTPSNCNRIVICFITADGSRGAFSDIMMANGTEAKPFRPYVADTTNILTVGNTTLNFSVNGFGTAVVDCERENLQIDGTDNNAVSSVIDQYGNVSVEYLRLQKGSNKITFSGDITAVTVKPREWEL